MVEIVSNKSDSWPLETEPIGCPEKSVRNYHYMLRNCPEERSSQMYQQFARLHSFL